MHSSLDLLQHYRFEIREFYALTLSLLPRDCKYLYPASRDLKMAEPALKSHKKTAAISANKGGFPHCLIRLP